VENEDKMLNAMSRTSMPTLRKRATGEITRASVRSERVALMKVDSVTSVVDAAVLTLRLNKRLSVAMVP
jgi:hypothetical protein